MKKILKICGIVLGLLVVCVIGSSVIATIWALSSQENMVKFAKMTSDREVTQEQVEQALSGHVDYRNTPTKESEIIASTTIEESTMSSNESSESEMLTSEFTHIGIEGEVVTIKDMQEYLIENDNNYSPEEICSMDNESLAERYDLFKDFEQQALYEKYIDISSYEDYVSWFRDGEKGDILDFGYYGKLEVGKVFGNNEQLLLNIYSQDETDFEFLYVLPNGVDIPNLVFGDKVYLLAEYTGERSQDGDLIFNCLEIGIYEE